MRRPGRSRRCAATSAATSTSTTPGNLYLSTGDDSNPFSSDGYAPIDDFAGPQPGLRRPPQRRQHERPARQDPADQAQGEQAAATRSRRATCSPKGRAKTKPEIYAMGLRNPYRFGVNRANGRRVRRRLLAGRRQGRPERAARPATAAGSSSRSRPTMAGRTASTPNAGVHRLRLRDQAVRADVRLQGAAQRLAAQHRPEDAPQGRAPGRLVLVPCRRRTSRSSRSKGPRATAASPRWAARPTSPKGQQVRVPLPELATTGKPLFYEWTRDYIKDDAPQQAAAA